MPNLKLETYKNKATGTVYDYTDAAAQAALAGILDGTDIDSFEDVETALATKVDKVTGKGLSTNDYNNTAKGIVDNIQSNVIANTKLMKDSLGWSGKNKLPNEAVSTTINGVTFTVNADKSISMSGTAESTIDYMIYSNNGLPKSLPNVAVGDKFLGCPTGGSISTYQLVIGSTTQRYGEDNGSGGTILSAFDGIAKVLFRIQSGVDVTGKVLKPMIIDANVLDTSYETYRDTTAFPRDEQVLLGAKQLIPYPYSNTTKTENNVTFTDNGDGTVTISTSDTVSADTFFVFFTEATMSRARLLKYKKMILSGGISSDVFLQFWNTDGNGGIAFSNGDENVVDFTNASAGFNLVIVVKSGTTLAEPVTVSPLLRLATDQSPKFSTFAMSNEELTYNSLAIKPAYAPQDDLKKTGVYRINGYGFVFVINIGDGVIHQVFLIDAEPDVLYKRVFSNNEWNPFYKITGTVIS